MRVLFSSTTGAGHVLPMVPLARAVSAAGHQVRWATGAEAHPLLRAAGVSDLVACGPTGADQALLRGAVLREAAALPGPQRAAFVFPRMFGAALAPPMVADLLPVAREWRPDLLVHEQGELASPLVGALLDRPSVTHAFGGPVPAAHVAEAGDMLAPMWHEHGLDVPAHAGCFESLYLDICPASVRSESSSHIPEVQPLRPLDELARGSAARVPEGSPLVYVTMGTVQNRVLELGPLVRAVAELPVRLVVAVGQDGDPAELGDQPDNVRVERWVDQDRVLDECAAVVSHAGSGTFLGALARGCPQLCLPQAADQFRNAEGGRRVGAALVLMPGEISPSAVAGAVSQLLTDPGPRGAAARVAEEIAAMPSPGEVAGVLAQRFACED